jgi:hypothetical protein
VAQPNHNVGSIGPKEGTDFICQLHRRVDFQLPQRLYVKYPAVKFSLGILLAMDALALAKELLFHGQSPGFCREPHAQSEKPWDLVGVKIFLQLFKRQKRTREFGDSGALISVMMPSGGGGVNINICGCAMLPSEAETPRCDHHGAPGRGRFQLWANRAGGAGIRRDSKAN